MGVFTSSVKGACLPPTSPGALCHANPSLCPVFPPRHPIVATALKGALFYLLNLASGLVLFWQVRRRNGHVTCKNSGNLPKDTPVVAPDGAVRGRDGARPSVFLVYQRHQAQPGTVNVGCSALTQITRVDRGDHDHLKENANHLATLWDFSALILICLLQK